MSEELKLFQEQQQQAFSMILDQFQQLCVRVDELESRIETLEQRIRKRKSPY